MRATRGGLGAHSIVSSPTVYLYVRSRSERGGFESQALQAGPAPPTGHGSAWKETIDHEPGSRKHRRRLRGRRAGEPLLLQTALLEKATPTPACGNGETPG